MPESDKAQTHPAGSKTAILVQGMHASGTSILSRLIGLLLQPAGHDPSGEIDQKQSEAIAGLNRRVLQELGTSWNQPAILFLRGKGVEESAAPIREAVKAKHLKSAADILRGHAAAGEPRILDDPCICLLRDLWDEALRQVGRAPRVIHVFRNPLEVAASLRQSHELVQSKTLQLWVQYNLAALGVDGPRGPLVVPYTELADPDGGLIARLMTHLDPPSRGDRDIKAEWKRLIEPMTREASIPGHVVVRSPLVPSLVKRLFTLLTEWEARDAAGRSAELKDLRACFEDQSLFAGNLVAVAAPEQAELAAPSVSAGTASPRKLLLHYHLFKNAGTSVDAILRDNFGERWMNTEFPPRYQSDHQALIRQFIRDHPDLGAISSHTLSLPVPRIEGIEIFPIIFVRHPLDRMKSGYEFERKQDATTIGTQLAKEKDFAGYIRARLASTGDRSCRDFHVSRFAQALPPSEGSERKRAMATADRLPFVGLVEAFGASAERLQQRVRPMLPDFRSFTVRENVTAARRDNLHERLDDIRRELGEECFALVMAANEADMELYEKIRQSYAVAAES